MFYVAVRYPHVYLLYSQLLLSILFFSLTAFLTFTPTHVFIFIRTKKYFFLFLFLYIFASSQENMYVYGTAVKEWKKNIIYVFVRVFLLLISNKMLIFFTRKEGKKAGRMDLIVSYIIYVKEHPKKRRRKKIKNFSM